MRKILKKWLLGILGTERQIFKYSENSCGLVVKDGWMLVTGPDGTILPKQLNLKIEDSLANPKEVIAVLTIRLRKEVSE